MYMHDVFYCFSIRNVTSTLSETVIVVYNMYIYISSHHYRGYSNWSINISQQSLIMGKPSLSKTAVLN